jgi:hypothetical protein
VITSERPLPGASLLAVGACGAWSVDPHVLRHRGNAVHDMACGLLHAHDSSALGTSHDLFPENPEIAWSKSVAPHCQRGSTRPARYRRTSERSPDTRTGWTLEESRSGFEIADWS